MSSRRAVVVIAGVVLALGIALALWPTSIAGGEVGCGSAIAPDTDSAGIADYGDALSDVYSGGNGGGTGRHVALCEDRVSAQRVIAFPVIAVGGLALLFVLLTSKPAEVVTDPS